MLCLGFLKVLLPLLAFCAISRASRVSLLFPVTTSRLLTGPPPSLSANLPLALNSPLSLSWSDRIDQTIFPSAKLSAPNLAEDVRDPSSASPRDASSLSSWPRHLLTAVSGALFLSFGRRSSSAGAILTLLCLVQGASASVSLRSSYTFASGGGTGSAFGKDINGDGIFDAVVSNNDWAYILFISPTGTVKSSQRIAPNTGNFGLTTLFNFCRVGLVDVNGDGIPDLIGVNSVNGAFVVVTLDRSGLATSTVNHPAPGEVFAVSGMPDLNNDGVPEILYCMRDSLRINFMSRDSSVKSFTTINSATAVGKILATNAAGTVGTQRTSNDNFGVSCDSSADVNGDGLNEIAVGASTEGAAYVIFLGAGGQTLRSSQKIATAMGGFTGTSGNQFGFSIALTPDINGDGVADLVVGLVGGPGAAFLLFLNTDASVRSFIKLVGGLDILSSVTPGNNFAYSLAIGDFGNDGSPDLVVGQTADSISTVLLLNGLDVNECTIGAHSCVGLQACNNTYGSFVCTGVDVDECVLGTHTCVPAARCLNTPGSFSCIAPPIFSRRTALHQTSLIEEGRNVDFGGDVNGDGFIDAVSCSNNGGPGQATILFLSGTGTVKSTKVINSAVLTVPSSFGQSCSLGGDLNRDGIPDLVVGSFNTANGGSSRGQIHVISLTSSGAPWRQSIISGETFPALAASITNGANFGFSVDFNVDLNCDGVPDVAVGGYGWNNYVGGAWIIFLNLDGSAKSFNFIDPTTTVMDNGVALSSLVIPANQPNFGFDVSFGADVNRDGFQDLVVGGMAGGGGVYIMFLSPNGASVRSAQKISATVGGFTGVITGLAFGSSVSLANDLNMDGDAELAVGYLASDGGANTGGVFLISLNRDGTSRSFSTFTASTVPQGLTAGAHFGCSVAIGPDFNSDGSPDIIVGAYSVNAACLYSIDNLDVNECVVGTHRCPTGTGCFNTYGSYQCTTMDVDECVLGSHTCVAPTTCTNTIGSFTCTCPAQPPSPILLQALTTVTGVASGHLGIGVSMGDDVNGDGFRDALACEAGTGKRGLILFLSATGSVKSTSQISTGSGGFTLPTTTGTFFDSCQLGVDISGDGIPDMLVGNNNAFTFFVVLLDRTGNAISSVSNTASDAASFFGSGVAFSPDLNYDGIPDVGVTSYLGGSVYLFYMKRSGGVKSSMKIVASTPAGSGVVSTSTNFAQPLGIDFGDVNYDGVTDLVVSSPNTNSVFIIFRSPTGTLSSVNRLDTTTFGYSIGGSDLLGFSAALSRDINGDDGCDLFLGALNVDAHLIFLSRAGTVRSALKFSTFITVPSGVNFARAVSIGADANRDGSADLMMGASDGNQANIYMMLGLDVDECFLRTHTCVLPAICVNTYGSFVCNGTDVDECALGIHTCPISSGVDCTNTPGSFVCMRPKVLGVKDTVAINGFTTGQLGRGVSFGDDVNNDGNRDAALCDYRGRAIIIFLSAQGTVKSSQQISTGNGGFTVTVSDGAFIRCQLGVDLSGDGIPDLVGGNFNANGFFVVFLSRTGTNTATTVNTPANMPASFGVDAKFIPDSNYDGIPDILIGADGSGVVIFYMKRSGSYSSFTKIDGSTAIGSTGTFVDITGGFGPGPDSIDINYDGVPDLSVTANQANEVRFFFMSPTGTVKSTSKIGSGTNGFTYTVSSTSSFGQHSSISPDLNGDGGVDLLVGAWADDAYLIFLGRDGSARSALQLSSLLTGTGLPIASSSFGYGVGLGGDADRDGSADLIVGSFAQNRGDIILMDALDFNECYYKTHTCVPPALCVNTYGSFLCNGTDVDECTLGTHTCPSTGDITCTNTHGSFVCLAPISRTLDVLGRTVFNLGGKNGAGVSFAPDINGDGYMDAASSDHTGTPPLVQILFMGPAGVVKSSQKIATGFGGFTYTTPGGSLIRCAFGLGDYTDINGDGMADMVCANNPGGFFVVMLDRNATVLATKLNNIPNPPSGFASDISLGPDLDCNGVPDVAAGSYGSPGGAFIFFLKKSGSVLSYFNILATTPVGGGPATLGFAASDQFGIGVTLGADVNGDGIQDMIVGSAGASTSGAAYVLFLAAGGGSIKSYHKIDSTDAVLGSSLASNTGFGWDVSVSNDLNGDGGVELAVGCFGSSTALLLSLGRDGSVRSFARFAPGSGLLASYGPTPSSFGYSTAIGGDLNRDGLADMIVGAQGAGEADLFMLTGFDLNECFLGTHTCVAPAICNNTYGSFVCSGVDVNECTLGTHTCASVATCQNTLGSFTCLCPVSQGAAIIRMTTINDNYVGGNLGSGGSFGDDIDGDGIRDAVFCQNQYASGGAQGRAMLLFLTPTGTVRSTQQISSNVNGFTLSTSGGVGNFLRCQLGTDLSGDGIPELLSANILSATFFVISLTRNGTASSSVVNTVSGASSNFGADVKFVPDLDFDGIPDIVIGDNGAAGAAYLFYMKRTGTFKSFIKIDATTVVGAGPGLVDATRGFGTTVAVLDINFDGVPDLAVGASTGTGEVRILFMDFSGAVTSVTRIGSGTPGFNLTLGADSFGQSISLSPDINGDGGVDLAVGATSTNSAAGDGYLVFLGRDASVRSALKLSILLDDFAPGYPPASSYLGFSIALGGDANRDGSADLTIGNNVGRADIVMLSTLDFNECFFGTHTCVLPAICVNTYGSFVCNGTDVNECALGTHTCPTDYGIACSNTPGSFICLEQSNSNPCPFLDTAFPSDSFSYPLGTVQGQGSSDPRWSQGAWLDPPAWGVSCTVVAGSLTYPGYESSGGRLSNGNCSQKRLLPTISSRYPHIWVSFLMTPTTADTVGGSDDLRFYSGSTQSYWIGCSGGFWFFQDQSVTYTSTVPCAQVSTLVVMHMDYANGASTMYVNPPLPALGAAAVSSRTVFPFDNAQLFLDDGSQFDELRLACCFSGLLKISGSCCSSTTSVAAEVGVTSGALRDENIIAFSSSPSSPPWQARRSFSTGWVEPTALVPKGWIQIDLGASFTVVGVASNKNVTSIGSPRVLKYNVAVSSDQSNFTFVGTGFQAGDSNSQPNYEVLCPAPTNVRYVRLYPTAYTGSAALTLEVFVDNSSRADAAPCVQSPSRGVAGIGLVNATIAASALTAFTNGSVMPAASGGLSDAAGWRPAAFTFATAGRDYLQIRMNQPSDVAILQLKGGTAPFASEPAPAFSQQVRINSSTDGVVWRDLGLFNTRLTLANYNADGQNITFCPVLAGVQFLRITPTAAVSLPAIRAEVYVVLPPATTQPACINATVPPTPVAISTALSFGASLSAGSTGSVSVSLSPAPTQAFILSVVASAASIASLSSGGNVSVSALPDFRVLNIAIAIGTTSISISVAAGSSSGAARLAYRALDATGATVVGEHSVPADDVFVVTGSGATVQTSLPAMLWASTSEVIVISLGQAVPTGPVAVVSVSVSGSPGATLSSPSVTIAAGMRSAVVTLAAGATAGTVTLTVSVSGGVTVAATSFVAQISIQGKVGTTLPQTMFLQNQLSLVVTLSAPVAAGTMLHVRPVIGGSSGGAVTPAVATVFPGQNNVTFVLQSNAAVGNLLVDLTLMGSAKKAYRDFVTQSVVVRDLAQSIVTLDTNSGIVNNAVNLAIDLTEPAGEDVTYSVTAVFCPLVVAAPTTTATTTTTPTSTTATTTTATTAATTTTAAPTTTIGTTTPIPFCGVTVIPAFLTTAYNTSTLGATCSAPVTVTRVLTKGTQTSLVSLDPPTQPGTIYFYSTVFLGATGQKYRPAAAGNATIIDQIQANVTGLPKVLIADELSGDVKVVLGAGVPSGSNLRVKLRLSGRGLPGSKIVSQYAVQDQLDFTDSSTTVLTFKIKAGLLAFPFVLTFSFVSTTNSAVNLYSKIAPVTIPIVSRGNVDVKLAGSLATNSMYSSFLTLSAPPTRGSLTISFGLSGTAASSLTFLTGLVYVVDVPSTTATAAVTATTTTTATTVTTTTNTTTTTPATTTTTSGPVTTVSAAMTTVRVNFTIAVSAMKGAASVIFTLSGDGAVEYNKVKPSLTVVLDGTSIGASVPATLYMSQMSDPISLLLGSAISSSGSLTVSVVASPSTAANVVGSPVVYRGGANSATFAVVGGSSAGPVTLSYQVSGDSASLFSTPPVSAIGILQRATATVSGLNSSVTTGSSTDVTIQLSQPIPTYMDLTVDLSINGTAATGSSISDPPQLIFGAGSNSAKFTLNAGYALQDLQILYSLNGSATVAVFNFPTSSLLVVGTVTSANVPSVCDISSAPSTGSSSLVLSAAVPATIFGSVGVLNVTMSVSSGNISSALAGAVNAGQSVTFSIAGGSSLKTLPFDLVAPAAPQLVSIHVALSGSAANVFVAPSDVTYIAQSPIQLSGVPKTIPQSALSSPIQVTLASPVPYSENADDVVVIQARLSGSGYDSQTSLSPPGLEFVSQKSQDVLAVQSGSAVGDLKIDLALLGNLNTFYRLQTTTINVIVTGTVNVTGQSSGMKSGSRAVLVYKLSAAVPAKQLLTVTIETTGGASVNNNTLVIAAGATSGTFAVTAPATSSIAAFTVYFSHSGSASDKFVAATNVSILATSSGAVGMQAQAQSLYGTKCTNVSIAFGDPLSGTVLGQVVLTGTGTDTDAVVSQLNGNATQPFLIGSAGASSSGLTVCAGKTTGSLTVSLSLSGPGSAFLTQPPAVVIQTTAQLKLAMSAPIGGMLTGTTTGGLSATIASGGVVPDATDLTIAINVNGPSGVNVNGAPLTLAAGSSSATFSVTSGFLSGQATLTYGLSGTAKDAFEVPVASTFAISYPPPSLSPSSIKQNSGAQGAQNTYTVSFVPSQPMSEGGSVTISGIKTPQDDGVIFIDSDGTFAEQGQLTTITGSGGRRLLAATQKQLVVGVKAAFLPTKAATFQFVVSNHVTSQTASAMAISLSDPTFSVAPASLAGGNTVGLAAESAQYTLTTKTVAESSKINGATNILKFGLQLTKNLAKGSAITVSGIVGALTDATEALVVTGVDGPSVSSKAVYSLATDPVTGNDTYTLVMTLSADLPTSVRATDLRVALKNPLSAQAAPTLSVAINGPTPVAITTLSGSVLGAGQVTTATFTLATVAETTSLRSASNTLTFQITPSISLSTGDTIVISGLGAADTTATNALPIMGADAATYFQSSQGSYRDGVLQIAVASGATILSTDVVTFNISVVNPSTAKSKAAVISIAAQGYNPVRATTASGSVLQAQTQPPQSFTVAQITESSLVAGGSNKLTICLTPLRALSTGTAIVIEGLRGTGLADSTTATFTWLKTAGTLKVTGLAFPLDELTCFDFTLINPSIASAGVTPTISMSGGDVVAATSMSVPEGPVLSVAGGASTAQFVVKRLRQTSLIALEQNFILVCVKPNVALAAGGTFVVSGLKQANGPVSGALALDRNTEIFGSTCDWDLDGGKLTCTTVGRMPFNSESCLQFGVNNPAKADASRKGQVAFTSTDVSISAANLVIASKAPANTADSFLIGSVGGALLGSSLTGWYTKSVVQSKAGCAFCKIMVYLNPTTSISSSGASITITGLKTSSTANNARLAIDDVSDALSAGDKGVFGSVASWTQSTGTLVVKLAPGKSMLKGNLVQFSISSLGQPIRSQPPPSLQISVDGTNFADMEVNGVFQSSVPPKIVLVSPAAGAVGVSSGDSFVIQFDKSLQMTGSGSVQFYDSTGATVGSAIACETSATISINGGKQEMLQIVIPTAAASNPGTFYYLTMSSGCVSSSADYGSASFSGFTNKKTLSYYAMGGTSPSIMASTPAEGDTVPRSSGKLSVTFDQRIRVSASATSVQIVRDNGDVLASPLLVGVRRGADNYVQINDKTMTIVMSPRVLRRGGICANLVIPRGAVEGTDTGYGFSGTQIGFCTAQPNGVPYIVEAQPKNHARGVSQLTSSLSLTFDSRVQTGNGTISVFYKNAGTDSNVPRTSVANIDCSAVTVSGTVVTIPVPQAPFVPSTVSAQSTAVSSRCFGVFVSEGCIKKVSNSFSFPGFTAEGDWDFCVSGGAAPQVSSYSPVPLSETFSTGSTVFTLSFDQKVKPFGGSFNIFTTEDETTPVVSIPIASDSVTVSDATVGGKEGSLVSVSVPAATAKALFTQGRKFFVLMSAGSLRSIRSGLSFAGVLDRSIWPFDVATDALTKGGAANENLARRDRHGRMLLQKNSLAASTPGGASGLSAGASSIPSTVQTVQLIEEVSPGSKGASVTTLSNTYRLEPTGTAFSGPIRLCLRYNSMTADKGKVSNKISSALTSMLKQVKDKNGKPTYKPTAGDPQDDKSNSQLCVQLTSFSRYSVGGGIDRVTAVQQTVAAQTGTPSDLPGGGSVGVIYFSEAVKAASSIAWVATLLLAAIIGSLLLHF